MNEFRGARWAAVLACLPAGIAAGEDSDATARRSDRLDEIVVTAARMHAPLLVVTDPRAPRQPLPAHDGADYLKTVPGFSVIRKGGTDGDPVFRGMAASRVNVVLDGEHILGGCGGRMDPPTAYVFPETYDRIVVVKGPQTVTRGPGNSAATVSFERDPPRFEQAGFDARASALGASADRRDLVADLRIGTPRAYGELTGTRAAADDYEDGDGQTVHSAYERWSATGALGWTPDARTRIELTGILSDGEAAYADRSMDGVAFERDNVGLRFERSDLAPGVPTLEAQLYYNYVDHVMDNYSMRELPPTGMMATKSVNNPDRRTTGGRIELGLAGAGGRTARIGADLQENQHSLRTTRNQDVTRYQDQPRLDDAWFRSIGLFAEGTQPLGERDRLVAGLRTDFWAARDERRTLALGMATVPNPTAREERDAALPGGFVRLERDLAGAPATAYLGLGHVQRFPDYWELISAGKESVDGLSAFRTPPEKTTQLDAGLVYRAGTVEASLSMFVSDVDDFILIESGYLKDGRTVTVTRSVDARTWGGEADATWVIGGGWRLGGTLAYTRGENRTGSRPLGQIPPLELRTALDYSGGSWSAGLLWRSVADQERYALRQGSIVGQDLGPTDGFDVLSFNASWKPSRTVLVSAGVDNLLDETYAEHLSRGGAMVAGYEQTTRVNEPGRTLWLKLGASFD